MFRYCILIVATFTFWSILFLNSEMYRNQMESFGEDIILLLQGTFEEC